MEQLITYVHGVPVRQSGVTYQEIVRNYAKYVETGLTPEEAARLKERQRDLEEQLLNARLELEEYRSIGSRMLFRLLKNRYKNEVNT